MIIFDQTTTAIMVFLATIQDQPLPFDWTLILTIPDGNGINRNLITAYGHLTMANLIAQTTTNV